jgi:hypothetical protein
MLLMLLVLLPSCSSHQLPVVDGSPDSAISDGAPDASSSGACSTFSGPEVLGNVALDTLSEISGLAASRDHPGVLWVHNDSGGAAQVYALNQDGRHLGTYQLEGVTQRDWEDMAIMAGGSGDRLVVGDIGDNMEVRENISVHIFPEPAVRADQSPVTETIGEIETLELIYPDGAHDAEALLVDPITGDLYIVTKERSGPPVAFRAPAPLVSGSTITLERMGEVSLERTFIPLVTGGEVSPNGDALILRFYSDIMLWLRPSGSTLAEALVSTPIVLPQAAERQGEAICYAHDGLGYFTISEGEAQAINFFAATVACR